MSQTTLFICTDLEKGMHEMNEYKKTIIDCATSEFTKFLQLSVNMYNLTALIVITAA